MPVHAAFCTKLAIKRKSRIRSGIGRICQCHFTDKRFRFYLRRCHRPTGAIQHGELIQGKLPAANIRNRLSNTTSQSTGFHHNSRFGNYFHRLRHYRIEGGHRHGQSDHQPARPENYISDRSSVESIH